MVSTIRLKMLLWVILTLMLGVALSGCLLVEECREDADCPNALRCLKHNYGLGGVSSVCGVRSVLSDVVSDVETCLADTQADPENCGACGVVCAASQGPNVVSLCEAGQCVARACAAGFKTLADSSSEEFANVGCTVSFDPNQPESALEVPVENAVGIAYGAQSTLIADQTSQGLVWHVVPDTASVATFKVTVSGVSGVREVSGTSANFLGRGVAGFSASSGGEIYLFDDQGRAFPLDVLETSSIAPGTPHNALHVTTELKDSGTAFDVFWSAGDALVWFAYLKQEDAAPYPGAVCENLPTTEVFLQRCEVARISASGVTRLRLVSLAPDRIFVVVSGALGELTEYRLDLEAGSMIPSTTLVPDERPLEDVIAIEPWYEQSGGEASGIVTLGAGGSVSFFRMRLGAQTVEGRTLERRLPQSSGLSAAPVSMLALGAHSAVLGEDGLFLAGGGPGESEPLQLSDRALWSYAAQGQQKRVFLRGNQLLRFTTDP